MGHEYLVRVFADATYHAVVLDILSPNCEKDKKAYHVTTTENIKEWRPRCEGTQIRAVWFVEINHKEITQRVQ